MVSSKFAIAALLLLAACSQSDAPSEEVAEAAKQAVEVVEGDEAPKLARGPYAPRDECGTLPGADDFIDDVRTAIDERDAVALVALAAEDVKLDFGGGSGTAELRRRLGDPQDALWQDLAPLPDLGCAANSQGGITLPWYFEQKTSVDDPGDGFIVTGEGVPVYNAPDEEAPVLARLSWEAVEMLHEGPEYPGYRHVRLIPAVLTQRDDEAPLEGYVAEDRLRSLIDYRLTAASRNGRWRIISLVAGD